MGKAIHRRSFIQRAGAGTAVTITALSRSGMGANDRIQIGCIGTGGRCRRLMTDLKEILSARIVAVCDLWDHNLMAAKELAGPDVSTTKNYHDILENQSIDAVIIASPDHLHVPMTVDACEAGKDVYVEKPLTHDLSEGARVVEAQNKHKRIVQVGMQQRSMPQIRKAHEIMKSGALGKVHKVHLTWNRNSPTKEKHTYGINPGDLDWKQFLGPAPDQPFDEHKFRNWRFYWDFGGGDFDGSDGALP